MHKFLKMALKRAANHDYDEHADYYLCAIIVRGGAVISVGFNRRSTNAFVEHYTDRVRGGGREYCLSTHAEQDAVLQARTKTDLSKCKIYVARVRRDGSAGLARPCDICQNVLHSYGIKKAYYTISDNEYGVMNPQCTKTVDSVILTGSL